MRSKLKPALVEEYAQRKTESAKEEDLQWLLVRLSGLRALPYAERSQQGGNTQRVRGYGLCGYINGGPRFLHLYRPLLLEPERNAGQGLYLPGPLADILDNGLGRCKLYLNLVAKMCGANEKETPRLFLWLPATYQLEQEIEQLEQLWFPKGMPRYKKREMLERPWQEHGVRQFEVNYNDERVEAVLDFLRKNPTFGTAKPGWLNREIEPQLEINNSYVVHQQGAPRESYLTGPVAEPTQKAGPGPESPTAPGVGSYGF